MDEAGEIGDARTRCMVLEVPRFGGAGEGVFISTSAQVIEGMPARACGGVPHLHEGGEIEPAAGTGGTLCRKRVFLSTGRAGDRGFHVSQSSR